MASFFRILSLLVPYDLKRLLNNALLVVLYII